MNKGKTAFDYFFFVRKYAQVCKLFELAQSVLMPECNVSENAQKELLAIHEQTVNTLKKLDTLNNSLMHVCANCKEPCCLGYYNHFRSIDFWQRKYSSNPLDTIGIEAFRPLYIRLSIRLKIGAFEKSISNAKTKCDLLNDNGCKLEYTERPLKCIMFTCSDLRKAMFKEQKRKYAELLQELYSHSFKTFSLLKKEAGLGPLYGRLSLLFLP